jgi:hypothetical protein
MLSAVLALAIVGLSLYALLGQSRKDEDRGDLTPVRVRADQPRIERRRNR